VEISGWPPGSRTQRLVQRSGDGGGQRRSQIPQALAAHSRSRGPPPGAETTGGSAPHEHRPSGIALQKADQSRQRPLSRRGFWAKEGSNSRRPNPNARNFQRRSSLVNRTFQSALWFREAPALCAECLWFVFQESPLYLSHWNRFQLQQFCRSELFLASSFPLAGFPGLIEGTSSGDFCSLRLAWCCFAERSQHRPPMRCLKQRAIH